jgi:hypothetical protein
MNLDSFRIVLSRRATAAHRRFGHLIPALDRTRPALARTKVTAASIARLSITATFAYLLALMVPAGTDRPVLAPLTAILVLQASLYQTMRSGLRKVAAVTVGVLVAVTVSEFIGFSWWQLGLVIAGALVIGWMLRLGDELLEVPISAMLIFASAGQHVAAAGRIADTLIGALAGLVGGLIFAPPRVQPAREAVGDLAGRLAALLDRMAFDLAGDMATTGWDPQEGERLPAAPEPARVAEWLGESRALRDQIEKVDDTLREAADSAKLNPRDRLSRMPDEVASTTIALRAGLESLEYAEQTARGLARAVLDSSGIDSAASPVRDARTRAQLASVLSKLGEAFRTYGKLVQSPPSDNPELEEALAQQLAHALRLQDELAEVLKPRVPADGQTSEWPLRGEILAQVDRLRTGIRLDTIPRQPAPRPVGISVRQPASRMLRATKAARGPVLAPALRTSARLLQAAKDEKPVLSPSLRTPAKLMRATGVRGPVFVPSLRTRARQGSTAHHATTKTRSSVRARMGLHDRGRQRLAAAGVARLPGSRTAAVTRRGRGSRSRGRGRRGPRRSSGRRPLPESAPPTSAPRGRGRGSPLRSHHCVPSKAAESLLCAVSCDGRPWRRTRARRGGGR